LTADSRVAIAAGRVFVSVASVWEMAIKRAAGKLTCPDDVPGLLRANAFRVIDISIGHALAAAALPRIHGDPFDRMLVAQCRSAGLTLVTRDRIIAGYGVPVLAA
jgi:PIN domain nuclease of toxin-antitoxin system